MALLSAFLPFNTGCSVSFFTIGEAIPKALSGGSSIAWKVSDLDNAYKNWFYNNPVFNQEGGSHNFTLS